MRTKSLRELVISLDEYPMVEAESTLEEAAAEFEYQTKSSQGHRHLPRAMLVSDGTGTIVGLLNKHILTSIEWVLSTHHIKSQAAYAFRRASVRSIMCPASGCVDVETSVVTATLSMLRNMSEFLLVKENDKIIGLVWLPDALRRLSDLAMLRSRDARQADAAPDRLTVTISSGDWIPGDGERRNSDVT